MSEAVYLFSKESDVLNSQQKKLNTFFFFFFGKANIHLCHHHESPLVLYLPPPGLMGLFEKRRYKNFLVFVQEYDPDDPKTFKGFDARAQTMQELYTKFGLDANTADFTGHAFALYRDDE